MTWNIKKALYYGESGSGGPDYEVTKEVKNLLREGWEPFCVTHEKGEVHTYPWVWLKKQRDTLNSIE